MFVPLLLWIFIKSSYQSFIPHSDEFSKNSIHSSEFHKHEEVKATEFKHKIPECFSGKNIMKCLKTEIFHLIDDAIADNKTWHLSDQILVKRNQEFEEVSDGDVTNGRKFEDLIFSKLVQLLKSRILEFKFFDTKDDSGDGKKMKFSLKVV